MKRDATLYLAAIIAIGAFILLPPKADTQPVQWQKATASYYGPGLYGNRTGCGQTLTAGTIGVAHKSLRCGTLIAFRYNGRTRRARVIDRGPYVHGREFDLTEGLRARLGFPKGVATVRWRNLGR